MNAIEPLRARLPDAARDIKLNLQAVLTSSSLTAEQRWGVAVAAAIAARNPELRDAVLADARGAVPPGVIADAQAAAALMAMNNVYYRFRHMVGQPGYAQLPARLRMNRLAQPATSRADLELFSLAVSAINGCEKCVQAHEKVVREGGLTEEQVNDAIRIAATVQAAAVALELGEAISAEPIRAAV
jgi:alkyl hydroperoxide reductase subunit D